MVFIHCNIMFTAVDVPTSLFLFFHKANLAITRFTNRHSESIKHCAAIHRSITVLYTIGCLSHTRSRFDDSQTVLVFHRALFFILFFTRHRA